MQFNLKFDMNNAAFDDGEGGSAEVVRILRVISERIAIGGTEGAGHGILDINGNRVGRWDVVEG